MRKYRNGKQSREPRQLSKYSPEYIQYRGNRGGYSVKVGLCDITGDGDADTISVAWRNPANGKVENCTVSIPQSQAPTSGPNSLTATEAIPANGPNSLTATEAIPASGPNSLTATEAIPANGPSSLTASEESTTTTITFDVDDPATLSGHTDSQSRQWFDQYLSVGGYLFNVNSDGSASIIDPSGNSQDVTDSNTPIPGTDGLSVISNINAYEYISGSGDVQVSSFDYIPTP